MPLGVLRHILRMGNRLSAGLSGLLANLPCGLTGGLKITQNFAGCRRLALVAHAHLRSISRAVRAYRLMWHALTPFLDLGAVFYSALSE